MQHKNTLIAIAASAIISSVCTAIAFTASNHAVNPDTHKLSQIESQLVQIQTQLAVEIEARISMGQQLKRNQTGAKQPSPKESTITPISSAIAVDATQVIEDDFQQQLRERRQSERQASQQPGYRQQQLIESGFAREEAARIVQIEAEESLRQLQAQYDQRRQNVSSTGNRLADMNRIRAELGEQNYERYLDANGWPTSASIGVVLSGSPGENAGLKAGDKVLSYAGERVFNLNEINQLTIQGQVGESVLIEVDRNGESVQLSIPRGPIGINSGRRFSR
ncbi:MAG: C-terminal processing protease CtpA/Prc [Arenicella sp.]|jgi:C-terminal processing protease CtpA/Prc